VLDGGDCDVGIESAIVDCCGPHPSLLRPGALTRAQLEVALGEPLAEPGVQAPRASGTLASHYAPRAKVRLMSTADMAAALALRATQAAGGAPEAALYLRSAALLNHVALAPALRDWPCRAMPADAAQAAHELFAGLRALDASGAALIWIETPPTDPAWEGVRDRLQRAAH
jgi:L-threonylcarbamoyladenylate synthase